MERSRRRGIHAPQGAICVLHVGASTPLKQWPPDRWRRLAERIASHGYTIVLSAGPGEDAIIDEIDPRGEWIRYAGVLTLPQLWHLLKGAAGLVCPDTGIAHLGRLIGVPTVALFGPGSAFLSGPETSGVRVRSLRSPFPTFRVAISVSP
jgi:ADP-heptose:LPS heptosyltransferase